MSSIRIATYNVHKCRRLDRRVHPRRIAAVLHETGADIIALQEMLSIEDRRPELHQARFIAEELGFAYCIGENRRIKARAYGNVTLSRWPIHLARNYELTWQKCEPRGCLRADIEVPNSGGTLHIFNVHLGTAFLERRYQARRLMSDEVLSDKRLDGPRIVLGDFNEWTRGLATRLLAAQFSNADIGQHLRRARTYPGVLPLLHLDHIYFDRRFHLERLTLHRSRTALIASDHLPLVADLSFETTRNGNTSSS